MNIQERYDELDSIVRTLDELMSIVKDKYYYEALQELKYEAENDIESLEDVLQNEQYQECIEQEKIYWNSQF